MGGGGTGSGMGMNAMSMMMYSMPSMCPGGGCTGGGAAGGLGDEKPDPDAPPPKHESGWWSKYGIHRNPGAGVDEKYVQTIGADQARKLFNKRLASAGPLGSFICFAITDNIIREARNFLPAGIRRGTVQTRQQLMESASNTDGTKISKK